MVNEWTRDDLPHPVELLPSFDKASGDGYPSLASHVLDAVVDHLNANHPKSDTDRWRRAHEIVEGERDQARRERDMWKDKWLDTYEALHQARAERDDAEQRYRDTAKALTEWHGRWVEMERERDEWKARAEAAEARTAPAVSRADVAEALSRCLNPEMWNVTFPSVVSEVCDLFGVEAESADPVEEKARELYRAATPDARWETVADEYRRIAAHVLGQESGDE